MDGLSSASAVFAVVSLAVQLAETIHKLVDFWKAVEDAPDNITRIFQELRLLSKILTQSHELAQCHSFSDIFDEALGDCSSKIFKLYSKVEDTRKNLKSEKLRKRKWAAWKIVLQKAEIDSLQRSISDAKLTILLVQNNSLLARPLSTSNVYQFNQKTSHANTQIFQSMKITEQELAKSLAEKQNLLGSVAYCNEKLLPFHPDTAVQTYAQQDDNKQRDRSLSEDVVASHHGDIGSRKRYVKGIRGRHVAGSFSNIWTGSQEIREQVVHASGVKETAEDESQLIMYPSKWLARLGVGYGVKLSILASRGWQYSFQPFRAVPESSLIFQFCREGNLGGVRTLLSRGDASPYDRDPSGRTPLWYAALHHQLDISEFLLSEGADVQAMDWVNRRKPIDALYDGECNDIKLKIAMANVLGQYDAVDDDVKYRVIQRFLIFFRHAKSMDLSPSRRNEAALSIVQHISSYYLQTHPDLSGLMHNYLLPFYYDGPILQWVLRSVPGKIRNEGTQLPILHQAINKGLLLRDPSGVKTLVEKSTTADLHLYIENSSDRSPGGETPTSLAMYDWEGFLTWRTLLRELGFDMLDFVRRELAAVKLQGDGWTQETLIALFEQDLPLPSPPKSYNQRRGFRLCDRCQQPIGLSYLQKVDLEWRRKLRSIRTGEKDSEIVDHCSSLAGTIGVRCDIIDRTNGNGAKGSFDPLPYRIVCPRKCEDGVCVAWEFENFEPPNLPPYIPKEERKRLERLRLLEEEAKCPTYTMPGAFKIQ